MKCFITYTIDCVHDLKAIIYSKEKSTIFDILNSLGHSDCTIVNVSIVDDKKVEEK